MAVRRLAASPSPLDELNLPLSLYRAAYAESGLVLFAGHASAGKTTTMFSVLQEYCQQRCGHLITLEDPIEYRLEPGKSYVEQRELGRHFMDLPTGIAEAIRSNPDVIAVGELRDAKSVKLAIRAAERGVLVFATLQANNVPRTIARLVESYPAEDQDQVRMALAQTVRMIVAQALLRTRDGEGRLPAVEICHATTTFATLMREGKEVELVTMIESSRNRGMRSLDQALVDLVRENLVTADEAGFRAIRRDNVERMLK